MVCPKWEDVSAELPHHVVIRAAPDLPEGFLPPHIAGRWYDLRNIPAAWAEQLDGAVAVPSGRFEWRDDGAVAEVWEVHQ
jgi:hypothetical protein